MTDNINLGKEDADTVQSQLYMGELYIYHWILQ